MNDMTKKTRTVEQLESYQAGMGQRYPVKIQQLLSSAPRCLWAVIKRKGDATQWQTRPCPNLFEIRYCRQIQNELKFLMK